MKKLAQLVAFLSLALSLSAQADNPRLHMAVAGHQRAEVEALIKETPELVNAQDDHGITPIFVAMLVDDMEMAKYLLKNGADLKIGMAAARLTPLHLAVTDGKKAWADLFLASGATATMANHENHTVLHSAASGGQLEMAKLLVEKGADLKAINNDGESVLYVAAREGHATVVAWLLEKGADPSVKSKKGMTAAEAAKAKGHPDVEAMLAKAAPAAATPATPGAPAK